MLLVCIIKHSHSRVYSRKKVHASDFSEKGQKKGKKGQIFENLGKNVHNLKKF